MLTGKLSFLPGTGVLGEIYWLDVDGHRSDPPSSTFQELTSGPCASLAVAGDDLADTYSEAIPLPALREV